MVAGMQLLCRIVPLENSAEQSGELELSYQPIELFGKP